MTTDTVLEPVVKKLTVPRDAKTAFRFFTEDINEWWPKHTHSLGQENSQEVILEGKAGGRFYEILTDGTEKLWGTVQEWEPGKRLKYTWHLSRPAEQSTYVEITFDQQADGETLVTLTHTNWEVLADDAASAREAYNNGWEAVFHARFGEYAKTGEALGVD